MVRCRLLKGVSSQVEPDAGSTSGVTRAQSASASALSKDCALLLRLQQHPFCDLVLLILLCPTLDFGLSTLVQGL